jgi:hypothetical protein
MGERESVARARRARRRCTGNLARTRDRYAVELLEAEEAARRILALVPGFSYLPDREVIRCLRRRGRSAALIRCTIGQHTVPVAGIFVPSPDNVLRSSAARLLPEVRFLAPLQTT